MSDFKDLVNSIYEVGDADQRLLFGKYVEELRMRSANNKNSNAADELGVHERTFQRILAGKNVRPSTRKNLPFVLLRFYESIDDGNPILNFDEWVKENDHIINKNKDRGHVSSNETVSAPAVSKLKLARFPSLYSFKTITSLVGVAGIVGGSLEYWLSGKTNLASNPEPEITVATLNTDIPKTAPTVDYEAPELEEIDLLRITKSGEKRRSEHHPPKAQFTVWNGKLFLKDLTLPNSYPILKVEYSRFGESFTPFDPSDDQLNRSLASVGPFLVNMTYSIGGDSFLKEYDLTTQRDHHLKTVAQGFDITVKEETINRHVTCVDDVCAVQRSISNNALCYGPVKGGRLISGFDVYELDREVCKSNAPLPICLSEQQLGFELGRGARVVFEVDLIDGTSRRYDVSPRSEGILYPSGDFVSLDAAGGVLVHQCE